jgi:6-phosphogluconolactonase (cycloisomerase 2 family)
MAYSRAADGSLSPVGMFPTGGLGTGGGPDPLRSESSLILSGHEPGAEDGSHAGQLLFAVNAGSNEISAFAVERSGLRLVSKVWSGGVRPTSLTFHKKLLYVLNAGSGTITGFRVAHDGELTPLAGSTRPVTGGSAADAAQVAFSPDGKLLAVTGKTTQTIDTYLVDHKGLPSGPRPNVSNGRTPFGFAFDNRDHLVATEAGQGSLSSYEVSRDGALRVVSASVPDFQAAPCWVVITDDGHFAFAANGGSGSVSSYRIRSDGSLVLLRSVAGTTDPGGAPLDEALSTGSRYLYVLNGNTGTISAFRVGDDGSLSRVGGAGGLPPYAQGIAAR